MTKPAVSERVRADRAACILGVERRTVQSLAQRGQLPGAAKVGRIWTFNELALRNWLAGKAAECENKNVRQSGATGVVTRSGVGSSSTATSIEKAYEQALSNLRENVRRKLGRA